MKSIKLPLWCIIDAQGKPIVSTFERTRGQVARRFHMPRANAKVNRRIVRVSVVISDYTTSKARTVKPKAAFKMDTETQKLFNKVKKLFGSKRTALEKSVKRKYTRKAKPETT